ncbi:MFS transporter [Phytohabitans kaempferiae]|uniref:MFS transporter n=1 Tax=Phytohabitans kaempferiae TaxID=1620943 RepID=A0ABV6M5L3_9ACTN
MLTRFLINRSYAKLWAAGVVSWVGDHVFDVTVILWISTVLAADQPWAPAAVSGVLAAVVVPTILISPIAGVYVDRWDNRRTMLVSDLLRMGLVGALALLPFLPDGTVPLGVTLAVIYATVFVSTAISRFFTPARFAVVADVVEPEHRAKASGIGQASMAIAGIVGPPLAAPLLFGVGVGWALVINAASFFVSFLFLYGVRTPAPEAGRAVPQRPGVWSELRAGLAVVGSSRVLVALLVSAMVANFGAYLMNTLNVFFVTDNLGASAELYGFLGTAFGVGAVAGAALSGAVGQRLGLARTYWVGLIATGVLMALYARSTTFAAGLLLLLLLALPLAAMNTVVAPIVMRSVPRDLLGRVFGLVQPAIQLMSVVSIGAAGWLSSSLLRDLDADVAGVRFGTYDTIFLGAGILIAICGTYAWLALRGSDAPAEVRTEAEPNRVGA